VGHPAARTSIECREQPHKHRYPEDSDYLSPGHRYRCRKGSGTPASPVGLGRDWVGYSWRRTSRGCRREETKCRYINNWGIIYDQTGDVVYKGLTRDRGCRKSDRTSNRKRSDTRDQPFYRPAPTELGGKWWLLLLYQERRRRLWCYRKGYR